MKKIEMPTKEIKNFSEVFELFIISQTAKGVADVTIRNYRYHMKNMSHYFDTEKPFEEITKRDIERDCYEELFGESLAAQNDRYTKSGHAERCKTIDEYRKSARTCPEETIVQFGNRSGSVSPETVEQFLGQYLAEMRAAFGDRVRFLDIAIHNDESVPHAHIRRVWCATGKDGLLEVSQAKALEQLGIERPDPTKKESRHNNRKQTFSQKEREIALACARKCGLEIEEIPAEPGKQTMALEQYVAQKEREALAAVHAEKEAVKEEVRKLTEVREEVRAEVEKLTQEKTRLQRLVSRLSDFLARLFGKL